SAALLHPPAQMPAAPATYTVAFQTTRGPFTVAVHRAWAPLGADRFYYLVKNGYYTGAAFFRVVPGFVVQWGVAANQKVNQAWENAAIPDDPVVASNTLGMICFAKAGPNTRTTQVFINFRDNSRLDKMGFAPFGQVTQGMNVVDELYGGYGDFAPRGHGVDGRLLDSGGDAYLRKAFPKMDRIQSVTVSSQ
ncbi:MAG: peptidylprolyl isomerase, partial [Terriglobales bacterium]